MRKNNIFLRIAAGVLIWSGLTTTQSCNFLDIDQYIHDLPSMDSVFMNKENTLKYLAGVYNYLPDDGNPLSSGSPWIPVADESICVYREADGKAYFNYFSNDNMSAYDKYFQKWAPYYEGIRNASVFLQRVSECEELTPVQLRELMGEAYFLRAYFYFELMKEYGPVPIAPLDGFSLDTPMEDLLVARNTWDECIQFVVDELNKAAENLPENRADIDFGKPTRGAAYAVMSRLLLYNASPLFNGGSTIFSDFVDKRTGKPYFNTEKKNEKWAEAAWAAKKVIVSGQYELYSENADQNTPALPVGFSAEDKRDFPDGAAGIDPFKSYKHLFDGTVQTSDNDEVIFGRPKTELVGWVKSLAPFSMGGKGASYFNVTQELVDAYYMADGRDHNNSSAEYPYNISDFSAAPEQFSGYLIPSGTNGMYLNREARFYTTVGFCNSQYYGTSTTEASIKNFPCLFFASDKNGMKSSGDNSGVYCMTGYLCRKYLHNEDNFQYNGLVRYKMWMMYRLAEVYLTYAEALNELNGSYTVNNESFSRNPSEIRKYFNMIRFRAGLPGMTAAEAQDQEKVREMIRRERQVELAWEGHRYFDCRRWLIADVQENKKIRGMDVSKDGNDFYNEVVVNRSFVFKTFTKRQYFWPIPQDEITRNPNLVQSPGW